MSSEALISVIIPVYNVEAYLDCCVQSIVSQSYKNLEIILVDDGSSDLCPAMCDAWAEKDSRVEVIHKTNGGVSSARNAGLDLADGDYVVFVDADDSIEPELIEALLYHQLDAGAITVSAFDSFTHYYAEPSKNWRDTAIQVVPMNKIQNLTHRRSGMFCWGILFPRRIIDQNPCLRFDPVISNLEDVVWMSELLGRIQVLTFIPCPLYHYRIRPDSITTKCVDRRWQAGSWVKAKSSIGSYARNVHFKGDPHNYRILRQARRHCINNFYSECYSGHIPWAEMRSMMPAPLFEAVFYKIALPLRKWIRH